LLDESRHVGRCVLAICIHYHDSLASSGVWLLVDKAEAHTQRPLVTEVALEYEYGHFLYASQMLLDQVGRRWHFGSVVHDEDPCFDGCLCEFAVEKRKKGSHRIPVIKDRHQDEECIAL
jgi:hypothetical protein